MRSTISSQLAAMCSGDWPATIIWSDMVHPRCGCHSHVRLAFMRIGVNPLNIMECSNCLATWDWGQP